MSKVLIAALLVPLAACGRKETPNAAAEESDAGAWMDPGAPREDVTDTERGTEAEFADGDEAFLDRAIAHHEAGIAMAEVARERATHPELKSFANSLLTDARTEIVRLQGWKSEIGGDDLRRFEPYQGYGAAEAGGVEDEESTGSDPMAGGAVDHDHTVPAVPSGTAFDDPYGGVDEDEPIAGSTAHRDPMAPDVAATGTPSSGMPGVSPESTTAQADGSTTAQTEDTTTRAPLDPAVERQLTELREADRFDLAFLDAMIRHHEQGMRMAKSARAELGHPGVQTFADQLVVEEGDEVAQLTAWREKWYPSSTGRTL